MVEPKVEGSEPSRIRQAVRRIAADLASERITSADRASLRRDSAEKDGKESISPAFWRLAVRLLEPLDLLGPDSAPWRDEAERRWSAIATLLAREGLAHDSRHPLGKVLAKAEITELRVLRLARAEGPALRQAVRTVAHQLASGGQKVDCADFAELILSDGAGGWGQGVRRRLCRDYYYNEGRGPRASADQEES